MSMSCLRPVLILLVFFACAAPALAADVTNAEISGEADFNMYCASCHGQNGKGDGPKSFALSMAVPDLTTLSVRYGSFPKDRLMRLIDGREPIAGHGEREMPVWGVWFKQEAAAELGGAEGDDGSVERRVSNLVDYIATLQTGASP